MSSSQNRDSNSLDHINHLLVGVEVAALLTATKVIIEGTYCDCEILYAFSGFG